MRLLVLIMCIVALIIVASQGHANQPAAPVVTSVVDSHEVPLAIGTSFPEPISTVFILGGAVALGLWKLARKFELV